ncbi:hypothetical protein RSAG8_09818, partial [Rhizoctonia solani AG-8 WAC10335]
MHSSADSYPVARKFLSGHNNSSYYIRPDSYTDRKTGATHVYPLQFVDHLEVCNGDINLNIRDGHILSYGDSFFRGNVSLMSNSRPTVSLEALCIYSSPLRGLRIMGFDVQQSASDSS